MTIGVFDGVHRGHERIVREAVGRARAAGVPSVVLTFDPHPSEVVRPGSHPALLTGQRHKGELLAALGVDVMLVVPFTLDFSRVAADEFVHEVLVQRLHATAVVVGENFRFGHRAAGDLALLTTLGHRFGFEAVGVPLVVAAGEMELSSTYVRACVAAGDVAGAAVALGRPHRLEGVVVRGDRRGRTLGYPTANVETLAHAAVPADGVYAGRLSRGAELLPAAVSVGTNPTFEGQHRRVEAYVIGFDGDLYGEHVGVDFVARLRGMLRFEGPDAVELLRAQIAQDIVATEAALAPADPVALPGDPVERSATP